jgi:hypothetical protein
VFSITFDRTSFVSEGKEYAWGIEGFAGGTDFCLGWDGTWTMLLVALYDFFFVLFSNLLSELSIKSARRDLNSEDRATSCQVINVFEELNTGYSPLADEVRENTIKIEQKIIPFFFNIGICISIL